MTADLPDAEALYTELIRQLEGRFAADAGVVGIVTGGAWLAERLHRELGFATPIGALDVAFYRDDFDQKGLKNHVRPSRVPFEVQGRRILLVDDVLYTGRTVRAAMNELFDYGRPAAIELAVLCDRGGRELPIAARYAGGEVKVPAGSILMLERDANGRFSLRLSDHRRERPAS